MEAGKESGDSGTDGKNAVSIFCDGGTARILERESILSGESEQSGGCCADLSEVSGEDYGTGRRKWNKRYGKVRKDGRKIVKYGIYQKLKCQL